MKSLMRLRAWRGDLRVVALVIIGVFAFSGLYERLSSAAPYQRPNPLMDYVPQEVGIYDTWYSRLEEFDCRKCHGDSLADRHHHTEIVLRDGLCFPCHELTPDPPGVVVIRDCTTGGCHSWDDVPANGWHHDTDLSGSENCVACHDRNLVSEISPFSSFAEYPPSVATPSIFSCQNCHWEQYLVDSAVGFDPDASPKSDAGHPSTYDYYNQWGQFVGYHEYGREIDSNLVAHHMGFKGNVVAECVICHANDPNDQSYDPTDPEAIRYCQICHDVGTLHNIVAHMGPPDGSGGPAVEGWEAAGFHVGGSSTDIPSVYRGNGRDGFGTNPNKYFDASEQCIACHGENPPDRRPDVLIQEAHLDALSPNSGTCGGYVLLTGEHFGSEHNSDRGIQLKPKDEPGASWVHVPVRSWSNTMIEWALPCWTFSPGNYNLRVYTELGVSNWLVFTAEDHPASIDTTPDSGPCSTWISLSGPGGFGHWRKKVFGDGYHGIHHVIDVVSPTETYTAKRYRNWSDTSLEVRFWNMFIDESDQCTGQRNFIQDNASSVPCMADGLPGYPPCDNDCAAFSCPEEPDINGCESMDTGTYSVYLKAIYFGDEDRSGGLSCGDTIFHVATSDALSFTLEPYIDEVAPQEIVRGDVLTIHGKNFGTDQMSGVVYIGSRTIAKAAELDQGKVLNQIDAWGDTEIRVKLSLPPKWENKSKYVWIEKDGLKSNFRKITILENLDPDSDGVLKDVDNCPDTPNLDQSDTDGDGLGDICDSCPGDPNNDVDSDGVCGDIDNCPDTANLDQSDTDGDGLGDACDNCPEKYNAGQRDTDNDGIGNKCDTCPEDPTNDADEDGVCGAIDNCTDVPNPDQADVDRDGQGDACDLCPNDPGNDADSDGVCEDIDNCPGTANPDQLNTDGDGTGDVCDACPNDPDNDIDGDNVCGDTDNCPVSVNPDQADADGDSIGDACDMCPNDPRNNADGDGVCGDVDNCPVTYNPDQADVDGDGQGDACDVCPNDPDNDVDSDGVCGDIDNCPATPNADQVDSNFSGIGDACEPIADAGSDLTIISGDQAITVLQGAASDPNDDPCTFRWVEGGTELSTWQAAGENGACYLDLNTVPSFSSGDHTLTLEVDDGAYTASDNMVITVFPNPEIALVQASITGGIGGNGMHFYVGDMVTFTIEYEITGGNPADQYEVAGVAVPQYPYCTNNQRRARTVEYVGPGVHTISFQKRVPGCADNSGWTVVKWRVDLRQDTEDGSILRDRDRLDTNDALVIYGS